MFVTEQDSGPFDQQAITSRLCPFEAYVFYVFSSISQPLDQDQK